MRVLFAFAFLIVALLGMAEAEEEVYGVQLKDGQNADAIAAQYGFRNLGQVGSLANVYRFTPLG